MYLLMWIIEDNTNSGDVKAYRFYCCLVCMLTLMNVFSIFISNRDVMYLSDIKSSVEMLLLSVKTYYRSVKMHQDAMY